MPTLEYLEHLEYEYPSQTTEEDWETGLTWARLIFGAFIILSIMAIMLVLIVVVMTGIFAPFFTGQVLLNF